MSQRTITSPGVEIRESDLSLIAPLNIGTNVFITGFAQQGPVDEVLKITTRQELVNIFGTPSTSAERYFYHSIGEMLNSPANIYASRLPYGTGTGDGFGSKYSALAYPVTGVGPGTSATGTITITDFTELNSSDKVNLIAADGTDYDFVNGSQSSVNGTWESATSNDQTATNLMNVINTSSGPSGTRFSASVVGAVITVTQNTVGTTGNTVITLTDTGSVGMSKVDFTGGTGVSFTSLSNVTSGAYVLGSPVHLELTEAEYLSAMQGTAFTWEDTGSLPGTLADLSTLGKAGVVVLNKAQTTINGQFEGFYVGIADNTNLDPSSNFNSIVNVETVTSAADVTSAFTTIPTGTLQFSTSAVALNGTANSISEVMENLTDYNIDGREDDDLLNLGVFKLRKSTYANEAYKLDYVVEDGIVGSFNAQRTQLNPLGGPVIPFFLESRDERSRNVEILVNDNISGRLNGADNLDADGNPKVKLRVYTAQLSATPDAARGFSTSTYNALSSMGTADSLYPLGAFSNAKTTDKVIGNIPSKIDRALDGIRNDEIYDIDVVVEGGIGTVYAAASAAVTSYYDEFNVNASLLSAVNGLRTSNEITGNARTLRNNYSTIFNKFERFCSPPYLGGGRGDCIFIADPLRHIFVTGRKTRILDDKTKNFQTDVYWPMRHQFEQENTSYACTYGNWELIYDDFTAQQVWVPFSGFAAAAMARTDAVAFPWFAPAGFTRGLVQFGNDIAVNPNQKQRDELYKSNINPVANFPAQGQVIFGQKTLSKKPSAFDRINVRRLFLTLERPTKKASRFFVFEQNSEFTRTRLLNTLTPIFERAKSNEGVYDYLLVCDERNNTPDVIDANELVVDIYIKPTRTAEFILVNFIATRTDANFEELING